MAVDEIRPNDFFKVLWKEFRINLVVSIPRGLNSYGSTSFTLRAHLSLTVSVSLMAVVVVAKTVGGSPYWQSPKSGSGYHGLSGDYHHRGCCGPLVY